MPRISSFYGIDVSMYWDEGDHELPHFHARYQGRWASVSMDGQLLAGRLPRRALDLLQDWIALHRNELLANWERARRYEPLVPIEPLA